MARPFIAASMIQTLRWPSVHKNADDSWSIVWNMTLADDHRTCQSDLDDIARRCNDDLFGFCVTLDLVSGRRLRAEVTTAHWSMDDPYYVLTYRTLAILDAELGPISTIENQSREWWRPFRDKEPSSLTYWDSQVRMLHERAAEQAIP